MAQDKIARRLAAIFAADMVGYSRLMEADETGTIARQKAHRRELIDPSFAAHDGRIVKTMGDGLLVEFASMVDAVACAIEIQRAMEQREAEISEDRRIRYRVGINLGDIVIDGEDILGDGVNVAARLETLADHGGICLSDAAYGAVAGKVDASFEDLGERKLKNIARPVHVWRWVPATTSESEARKAADPLPLPDKPSIAVLPFANMSGEAEQEFFTDGITEDILTELSRFRELFVISRTTAFKYKGKAFNIQEVARELGVQFALEGSVRKAGNRVRVTAQLIDAEADRHIWAERYDRDLEDIFAIQDEISQAIVSTLPGRVEAARRERAARKPTENMAAYELVLGAKVLHHRSERHSNKKALEMIERAVALDPNYAHAHAWKACITGQAWINHWVDDEDAAWDVVMSELEIALGLDDNDSDVHRILAAVNVTGHEFDKAIFHEDRTLALNPNDDLIVVQKGEVLTWLGRPEEGIPWIEKAMRLNPYHPERFWAHLGRAYFVAQRYPDAVAAFHKIDAPDHSHHAFLAASYARMEDQAAVKYHVRKALEREPAFSVEDYLTTQHYKHEADLAHHRESLLEAGLPA